MAPFGPIYFHYYDLLLVSLLLWRISFLEDPSPLAPFSRGEGPSRLGEPISKLIWDDNKPRRYNTCEPHFLAVDRFPSPKPFPRANDGSCNRPISNRLPSGTE